MTLNLKSNLTHSGCRVLYSGGLNHSKTLCSCVHPFDQANSRLSPHLRIRTGAFRHPTRGSPLQHLVCQVGGLYLVFSLIFLCSTWWCESLSTSTPPPTTTRVVRGDVVRTEGSATFDAWATAQQQHRLAHDIAMSPTNQHTLEPTSRVSSHAAAGETWVVARVLLCNPSDPVASAGGMRQWHDDVDRLLNIAETASNSAKTRSARWRHHESSTSVHSPSVRGARTEDLRAELNRRRAWEGSRITNDLRAELDRMRVYEYADVSMERAWEHCQNIEGQNCDGTSQVIRPTYSCPCPTDLRQPCRCPWITWQVRYLLSYLSRNVSPVSQTLQNIGDIEMRKRLHKLTFI
jgi:hypothetical protein